MASKPSLPHFDLVNLRSPNWSLRASLQTCPLTPDFLDLPDALFLDTRSNVAAAGRGHGKSRRGHCETPQACSGRSDEAAAGGAEKTRSFKWTERLLRGPAASAASRTWLTVVHLDTACNSCSSRFDKVRLDHGPPLVVWGCLLQRCAVIRASTANAAPFVGTSRTSTANRKFEHPAFNHTGCLLPHICNSLSRASTFVVEPMYRLTVPFLVRKTPSYT